MARRRALDAREAVRLRFWSRGSPLERAVFRALVADSVASQLTDTFGKADQAAQAEVDDEWFDFEEEDDVPAPPAERPVDGNPPAGGREAVNDPIQLEMLRTLRKLRKSNSDSSDDSEGSGRDAHGMTSDFNGIMKLRRRFRRRPKSFLDAFAQRVMEELGVVSKKQVWLYRDLSRKLTRVFGRMRGLHRVHRPLQEVIQFHHDGDADAACALTIQISKAIHQVALDRGDWGNAQLLIPTADAAETSKFGGDEAELKAVHRHWKSLRELQKSHLNANEAADDGEDAGAANDKKKSYWKKKERGGGDA